MVKEIKFKHFEIDYNDDKQPSLYHYREQDNGKFLIADEEFYEFWSAESLEEFAEYINRKYNIQENYKILEGK